MLDTLAPKPLVELNFKSVELRAMFAGNSEDVTAVTETGHDKFTRLNQEALAGWTNADHTTTAVEKNQREKALLAARFQTASSMAQATTDVLNDISKMTLASAAVSLKNGVLKINGENATLEQKLQLEEQSNMTSAGVTTEELDIQNYLSGKTNDIPPALHAMAEKRGLFVDKLDRTDFKIIMRDEYSDSPHILARTLDSHSDISTLSTDELLPPTADGGFKDSKLNSAFGIAADGTVGPPAPGLDVAELRPLAPTPAPIMAPSPM